jgi:transposase
LLVSTRGFGGTVCPPAARHAGRGYSPIRSRGSGQALLHHITVSKWRHRFGADRLDGLMDAPRPGAARTISDEVVEAVVVETLETAPPDATHWSTRSLAAKHGISRQTVSEIWRAFGLKPWLKDSPRRPSICAGVLAGDSLTVLWHANDLGAHAAARERPPRLVALATGQFQILLNPTVAWRFLSEAGRGEDPAHEDCQSVQSVRRDMPI